MFFLDPCFFGFTAHPDLPSQSQVISMNMSLGHHSASCKGTISTPFLSSATHKAFLVLEGDPVWAHCQSGHCSRGRTRDRYNLLLPAGCTKMSLGSGLPGSVTAGGEFICVKVCAWTGMYTAALFQGGNKFSEWYSFAENWPNLGLAKKRRKKTKAFCHITWHLMGKRQFSILSTWGKYLLLADILLWGDK